MKTLQPALIRSAAQATTLASAALATTLAVLLTAAATRAQSADDGGAPSAARTIDQLSRRGVFEGPAEVDREGANPPAPATDRRIRWLTFFHIYTDEVLSRYAPGGAVGARFDLFQFGDYSDAQPYGYSIHIVVGEGRTTLMGVVESVGHKELAGARAQEVPGVVGVENALVVAP
jgi:hypothetical protein